MFLTYSAAIKTYRRGWNSESTINILAFFSTSWKRLLKIILARTWQEITETAERSLLPFYVCPISFPLQHLSTFTSYAQQWTHKQNLIVKLSQDRHTVGHALECPSLSSKLLRFWCFPPCPGTAGPSWPHWKWRELKKHIRKSDSHIHKYRFSFNHKKGLVRQVNLFLHFSLLRDKIS